MRLGIAALSARWSRSPRWAPSTLWALLPLITREWQHHPWRHGVALLAVALGVALAWSVHLINVSALAEFSAAVRSANGAPDAVVRGPSEGFDERLLDQLGADPAIDRASPVIEIETYAAAADGQRVAVRVLGIDALVAAPLSPDLMPQPAAALNVDQRLAVLNPELAFVNAAARDRLGLVDGAELALQSGPGWTRLRVAGNVAAAGTPLVVVDIAAAQALAGSAGWLSRIDLRLRPGAGAEALAKLQSALPAGVNLLPANEAEQRVSNLSRAYRVNLTVLALVALFVGAFLVFSVVSLSVAQRTPAFALLGVLGMTAPERRTLVLTECAALGLAGSLLGLALGTAMAAAALRWLAGDLGGGYFPGIAPPLQVQPAALIGFAVLGVLSALAGGYLPAKQAQALRPALALKGFGGVVANSSPPWPGLLLLAAGAALAFLPPIAGLPIAAYAAVAALLFGGVAVVPAAVLALMRWLPAPTGALPLLALRRAIFQRQTATAAVAGVVASLALSVALTVMVTSFRDGVAGWLDTVLPADLYARSAGSAAAAEQAWFAPDFVNTVVALPGVRRVEASRSRALQLQPVRPAVTLIARDLGDPAAALPLLSAPRPVAAGEIGVYVSEAVVALYGAEVGTEMMLPIPASAGSPQSAQSSPSSPAVKARVLGVWRDYTRQFGAIAMDLPVYQQLSGDRRFNDLSIWLAPGADAASVQQALRAAAADPRLIEIASTPALRKMSLAIFDRSFAVTTYLQVVAIVIGLLGVAASLSAQVIARRKEFGLLAHLGLTRRQIVTLVAGEAAAWMAAGVLVGLLLGLAVSAVLVYVVNPQSFHWTMELVLPWARLALLCAAVLAAGVMTAAFSARLAARRDAVLAVKEDW